MLSARARRAESTPEHTSVADSVWLALSAAAENAEWLAAASIPVGRVGLTDIARALAALEDSIAETSWPEAQKFSRSNETRRWLLEHKLFPPNIDPERLSRHFVSRFDRVAPQNRKLFSELPDGANTVHRYPVGALPHESLADLKAQIRQTLDTDLARVVEGAVKDLDAFATLQLTIADLARSECHGSELEQLKLFIESNAHLRHKFVPEIVRVASPQTVLTAYAQVIEKWRREARVPILPTVYGGEAMCALARDYGVKIDRNKAYRLLTPTVLTQTEMLACALILQCASRWNFTTVVALTTKGIVPNGNGFIVTSLKGRTNQTAPDLVVSPRDHEVLRALRTLKENLGEVKALGWVASGEDRLFFNTHVARRGVVRPYANWHYVLSGFISRHDLPQFSLDQVRVQAINAFDLESASIEATQRKAGHATSTTTARYLDQPILRAINSSINLAYQRELERSVQFAIEGQPCPTGRLFSPVGDGSSCADPATPPRLDMLVDGLCEAHECHLGAGCPNRRIVIDTDALRDLTCTHRFYSRHWKALLDENAEAFEKHHLPTMLFTFGLREIVAQGPYRRYLALAEGPVDPPAFPPLS
ncbi:hypothetical protein Mpe_B0201 (plasmid) [Methylibium petroleiphilum PM1]|uniref:Uncharacterized protein n=1 Tax=Methylibium petroleiphilum (strain ATCC BAA-1232 / LMG 22953 / PM1) TaxID=420662 RepID=A2SN38_METPP|nr:hypothetical protein Mpe_B0201 [Methylibium petroleiphilum PM1]